MAILINFIGYALSCIPYPVLCACVNVLGAVFLFVPSRRRSVLLSNLRYAFPEWSKRRRRLMAKESASRMIEMGLFSLMHYHLSKEKKRHTVQYSAGTELKLKELREGGKPVIILLPHVCLFEAIAVSPFFRPQRGRKLGAIYRPNRNPNIDRQIKRARESTGLVTFSRKAGLLKAKKHLSEGNWLIVLFDQNAGDTGTLDLFLGRLISYTSLPDSLCENAKADPVFIFLRRLSFFRSEIRIEGIKASSSESISTNAHKKLESLIQADPNGLPEWLWSHGKWKVHSRVESRYRMVVKRKHVIKNKKIERKTNFFIRMPNWLGDVVMAVPLLLAIRKGRPDVRFTIVCKAEYIELLRKFRLADEFIGLPKNSFSYFWNFHKKISSSPDNYLLFTNSLRGDIEALLTGSAQRFGMKLPGRFRPLLSHTFNPVKREGFDVSNLHQTRLWEQMTRYFGLREAIEENPLNFHPVKRNKYKIGIIPGSSNTPEKRWDTQNWVTLIEGISKLREEFEFYLYGTNQDKEITSKIYMNCSGRVFDFAGRTSIDELADELASCALVIGNDTGSMHLANMVGTPVAVLFGPTNSTRTKPFFDSPLISIESNKSKDINSINTTDVLKATSSIFHNLKK